MFLPSQVKSWQARKREPQEADPNGPKINEGEEEFDPESLVVSKARQPWSPPLCRLQSAVSHGSPTHPTVGCSEPRRRMPYFCSCSPEP